MRRAFISAVATLALVASAAAQVGRPSEYQVKAVYLFNFSRFVDWPQQLSTDSAFAICVLGRDPFGAALDAALAGESVGGKSVVARRVSQAEEAAGCRIVYISTSEEGRLKEILAVFDRASMLTVSDIPRFSQRGGMIQFVLQGDRVRFEVNLTSAAGAGLRLSADLLKVATAVRRVAQAGS